MQRTFSMLTAFSHITTPINKTHTKTKKMKNLIKKLNKLMDIKNHLCHVSLLDIRRSEALEEFAESELEKIIKKVDSILIQEYNSLSASGQCLIYYTSYRDLIRLKSFELNLSNIKFSETEIKSTKRNPS